jgi:hypothetical protein
MTVLFHASSYKDWAHNFETVTVQFDPHDEVARCERSQLVDHGPYLDT